MATVAISVSACHEVPVKQKTYRGIEIPIALRDFPKYVDSMFPGQGKALALRTGKKTIILRDWYKGNEYYAALTPWLDNNNVVIGLHINFLELGDIALAEQADIIDPNVMAIEQVTWFKNPSESKIFSTFGLSLDLLNQLSRQYGEHNSFNRDIDSIYTAPNGFINDLSPIFNYEYRMISE